MGIITDLDKAIQNDDLLLIKKLLAQINYDHANFPTELVFRIHSDKGGEFMSDKFVKWCADKGIHKTSTAGYDPNNNPAEVSVGMIKRRSRYLLGGNRLSTTWWGMASLAAAQLYRADAGLEEYPRIPFGTRVMVVKDPKPKNAFVLQAEPATLFGLVFLSINNCALPIVGAVAISMFCGENT